MANIKNMRRISGISFGILLLSAFVAGKLTTFGTWKELNYHLPNDTHPIYYDITIHSRIDLLDFNFKGVVKIGVVVDNATREIVVHSRKLHISEIVLERNINGTSVPVGVEMFKHDTFRDFLKITSSESAFNVGEQLNVSISFNGTLGDDQAGFHKSYYINESGNKTWFALTHFPPIDARLAFPCYDEPRYKTPFKIQIVHGKSVKALSNMPIQEEKEYTNDTIITYFEVTPKMPTYLPIFLITDMEITAAPKGSKKIEHRVISRKTKVENAPFILNISQEVVDKLEKYLDVEYILPKLDHAGIRSLPYDALENFGLITYREDSLIFDPRKHSYNRNYLVVRVIAHETAHQWFGNLVTNKFWTYLWLNEGFARYMEYFAVDLIFPEWDIFDHFVINQVQGEFQTDAKLDTHPMSNYVEKPLDLSGIFDHVAYLKSSSVIRMIKHAIGQPVFRKGLQYYLKNRTQDTAVEDDLFDGLKAASDEAGHSLDIHSICTSWTRQKHFPVLKVERNYENHSITLTQSCYASPLKIANETAKWWIPYNFATIKNPNFEKTSPDGWFAENQTKVVLNETIQPDEWILFNKQQTGYYRVLYDETNWNLLSKQLNSDNFTVIHRINRAQLIDDLREFVMSDQVNLSILFDLGEYLKRETEYAPWAASVNVFNLFKRFLPHIKNPDKLNQFSLNVINNFFNTTGIKDRNDSLLQKYARTIITNLACEFGSVKCLNETYIEFSNYVNKDIPIQPNIREAILRNGIRSATADDVDKFWYKFANSKFDDDSERGEIIKNFGFIENSDILSKYLRRILSDEYEDLLTNDERAMVLRTVFANGPASVKLCMDIIKNNYDHISIWILDDLIFELSEQVITNELRTQFIEFLESSRNRLFNLFPTFLKAIKIINQNLIWISQKVTEVDDWLDKSTGEAQEKPGSNCFN